MTGERWAEDDRGLIEYDVEPDAGVHLSAAPPLELWWGSRIRWRRTGERRWRHLLVIDLHPMDSDAVAAVVLHAAAAAETKL